MAAPATGDLRFVRGDDPFGRLVQWATGSPYSHVQILLSPSWCVEAVTPRVRVSRVDEGQSADIAPWRGATREMREGARKTALGLVGRRYSRLSLVSDALLWAGCPISIDIPGEYNCAQLAIVCLGLPLDLRRTDPGRVYAYLTRGIIS